MTIRITRSNLYHLEIDQETAEGILARIDRKDAAGTSLAVLHDALHAAVHVLGFRGPTRPGD